MPDLKTDAAAARKVSWGFAPTPEQRAAILRLASMADRLADTEGLAKAFVDALGKADDTAWIGALQTNGPDPLQSCTIDGSFDMVVAAQAVQDYLRGE